MPSNGGLASADCSSSDRVFCCELADGRHVPHRADRAGDLAEGHSGWRLTKAAARLPVQLALVRGEVVVFRAQGIQLFPGCLVRRCLEETDVQLAVFGNVLKRF